ANERGVGTRWRMPETQIEISHGRLPVANCESRMSSCAECGGCVTEKSRTLSEDGESAPPQTQPSQEGPATRRRVSGRLVHRAASRARKCVHRRVDRRMPLRRFIVG